ncbi:MAG: CopG family transcriptional regulator [Actinomycetota bacterium]
MRTTIDLDEVILRAVQAIARDEHVSMGVVLSRLARKGLAGDARQAGGSGFPTFPSPPGAAPITLDTVNEYRDDE